MRQKPSTTRALPTRRKSWRARNRLVFAAVLALAFGMGLSAGTPYDATGSLDLTFALDVGSTARLSMRVAVPSTLLDASVPGGPTEAAGVSLRLTLLPRPSFERINHSN